MSPIESGTTIDPPVCAITYGSEISNAVVDYAKQQKAKLIVLGVRQASMVASHRSCSHRVPHHHGGSVSRPDRGLRIPTACNACGRLFVIAPWWKHAERSHIKRSPAANEESPTTCIQQTEV